MNNYFYPVNHFDINSELLYNEWLTIANKYNFFNRMPGRHMTGIGRLRIRWLDSELDDDPVMELTPRPYYDSFTNYNIIKDFQGSYTEKVVNNVIEFLEKKYPSYRVTFVRYQSLASKHSIGVHTDTAKNSNIRFFLIVWSKPGCYMQIIDEKIDMSDEGALYKLNYKVLHGPINDSDEHRLLIMFDVIKKLDSDTPL